MSAREIHFYELESGTWMRFRTSREHAKEIVDWMLEQSVRANSETKREQQPEPS